MPAPPVTSVNLALSWKHTDKSLKMALSQLTGIYKLHVHSDSSRKPPLFSTLGCVPCDCNEMVQAAWGTGKHGLGSTALEPGPTPAVAMGTLELLKLDHEDSKGV